MNATTQATVNVTPLPSDAEFRWMGKSGYDALLLVGDAIARHWQASPDAPELRAVDIHEQRGQQFSVLVRWAGSNSKIPSLYRVACSAHFLDEMTPDKLGDFIGQRLLAAVLFFNS